MALKRGKIDMADVELERLTVRYGSTVVVENFDLRIASGELVTLLGPSGCGKTTILRCIAGLERCNEGTIRIGGQLVESPERGTPPEQRNVNMVFQNYAIWPHMTVIENVSFGLKLMKLPRAEVLRRAGEALELVGLGEYGRRYGNELSGGQQQRVALARAIVTEPDVLLFDEPLSNLDASLREQMRAELRELHDRLGKTAIYVTHDQTEAMVMSDRVVLMERGHVVQEGPPGELFERPRTKFAAEFLGVANIWDGLLDDVQGSSEASIVVDQSGLRLLALVPEASDRVGARGSACIRAERVQITRPSTPGSSVNTWRGRIRRMSYQGSCIRCEVEVGQHIVRAETNPRVSLSPGDEVCVTIDPAAIIWLPAPGTEITSELKETVRTQRRA
jgi:iron(III) transport system ATP-binding protein